MAMVLGLPLSLGVDVAALLAVALEADVAVAEDGVDEELDSGL